MESSRTFLASRMSSRTHFEVLSLGLERQVLGLGLKASSSQKLPCSRLEDSLHYFFEWLKVCRSAAKFFSRPFFFRSPENFLKTFFWRSPEKKFWRPFFWNTCVCVLHPWPWPRAFLSLASRGSVLGRAVLGLGLGFFLCLWPWPRALCPQLHSEQYHSNLAYLNNCK